MGDTPKKIMQLYHNMLLSQSPLERLRMARNMPHLNSMMKASLMTMTAILIAMKEKRTIFGRAS